MGSEGTLVNSEGARCEVWVRGGPNNQHGHDIDKRMRGGIGEFSPARCPASGIVPQPNSGPNVVPVRSETALLNARNGCNDIDVSARKAPGQSSARSISPSVLLHHTEGSAVAEAPVSTHAKHEVHVRLCRYGTNDIDKMMLRRTGECSPQRNFSLSPAPVEATGYGKWNLDANVRRKFGEFSPRRLGGSHPPRRSFGSSPMLHADNVPQAQRRAGAERAILDRPEDGRPWRLHPRADARPAQPHFSEAVSLSPDAARGHRQAAAASAVPQQPPPKAQILRGGSEVAPPQRATQVQAAQPAAPSAPAAPPSRGGSATRAPWTRRQASNHAAGPLPASCQALEDLPLEVTTEDHLPQTTKVVRFEQGLGSSGGDAAHREDSTWSSEMPSLETPRTVPTARAGLSTDQLSRKEVFMGSCTGVMERTSRKRLGTFSPRVAGLAYAEEKMQEWGSEAGSHVSAAADPEFTSPRRRQPSWGPPPGAKSHKAAAGDPMWRQMGLFESGGSAASPSRTPPRRRASTGSPAPRRASTSLYLPDEEASAGGPYPYSLLCDQRAPASAQQIVSLQSPRSPRGERPKPGGSFSAEAGGSATSPPPWDRKKLGLCSPLRGAGPGRMSPRAESARGSPRVARPRPPNEQHLMDRKGLGEFSPLRNVSPRGRGSGAAVDLEYARSRSPRSPRPVQSCSLPLDAERFESPSPNRFLGGSKGRASAENWAPKCRPAEPACLRNAGNGGDPPPPPKRRNSSAHRRPRNSLTSTLGSGPAFHNCSSVSTLHSAYSGFGASAVASVAESLVGSPREVESRASTACTPRSRRNSGSFSARAPGERFSKCSSMPSLY